MYESTQHNLQFQYVSHLQKEPTPNERNAWIALAYHLSSQPLRTLRIRLKWAKPKLLPISLTHADASNQSYLPFDILRKLFNTSFARAR